MANTLRFKRGLVSTIPTAALGEPLFTTDTFDLYIGNGTTNTRFQKYIASGTTAQYLRGDGSLATFPTNIITGTGVAGQIAYWSGASTQTGSADLLWDNAGKLLSLRRDGGITTDGIYLLQNSNTFTNITGSSQSAKFSIYATNALASGAFAQIANLASIGFTTNVAGLNVVFGNTASSAGGGVRYYSSLNGDAHSHRWYHNQSEQMRLWHTTGNLAIGGTFASDSGQRLQVTGDTFLRGQTTIRGTTSNDTTNIFRIEQNGGNGRFLVNAAGQTIIAGDSFQSSESFVSIERNAFNPTSGGASHTSLRINPTINQTGGANGITRGLYIIPTLTAAADWRSIEWSNNTGWGLYGAGTAANYLGGVLHIGTTSPSQGLRIGTTPTLATSSTLSVNVAIPNSVTTAYRGILTAIGLNSSGFTLPNLSHFEAVNDGTHTAGVVTNLYGFRENLGTYSATNVYGFYGNIASGTGRWNLYMGGTAANYMNGNLGIGTTTPFSGASVNASLEVANNLTVRSYAALGVIANGGFGAVGSNYYLDSSNALRRKNTDWVSVMEMPNGGFVWKTAANAAANSVITTTTLMSLTAVGRLILGAGDSGELLQVNGTMKVTGASTFGGLVDISTGNSFIYLRNTSLGLDSKVWALQNLNTSGDFRIRALNDADSNGINAITISRTGISSVALTFGGAATFSSSVTAGGNLLLTNGTASSIGAINLIRTGTSPVASRLTFGTDGTGYSFAIGKNQAGTVTDFVTILDSGAANFTTSIQLGTAIAIGTTPDTNKPFKILKNINATVGINFENTSTSSLAFSAIQMGTDVTGGTKFTNLVYASSGVTANGVYNPDGTSLINNGGGGLNFLGTPTRFYTGGSNGVLRLLFDNEGTTQYNATTPTTNATDGYKQYSADVVAGNAAPHFRTENGAVIKLYQETTAVGNSTISVGGGSAVLDDTQFGGYTLRQVVQALRNQGILA